MAGLVVARQAALDQSTDPNLPHDDQGPQLNFTIWLLTGLSAGFLALRLYCKYLRGRGLWWDDYVLVVAWVRRVLLDVFLVGLTSSSSFLSPLPPP